MSSSFLLCLVDVMSAARGGRVVYKRGRSSTSPVVLAESPLDNPLRLIVFKLKHVRYLCCAVFSLRARRMTGSVSVEVLSMCLG